MALQLKWKDELAPASCFSVLSKWQAIFHWWLGSLFILLILLSRNKTGVFPSVKHCRKVSQLLRALFGRTLPLGKPGKYKSSAVVVPAFAAACPGRWAGSASQKCQATLLEMQPALVEKEVASLTRAGDTREHLPCFAARWTMRGYHQKANEFFSEDIFSLGHVHRTTVQS